MNKALKFEPDLCQLILSGEKTTTWRLFDDKDLQEGDVVDLLNSETKEIIGIAILDGVYTKLLGQVTEDDYNGHEKYQNLQAMLEEFRKYYGDRVGLNTEVKIIRFKLNS